MNNEGRISGGLNIKMDVNVVKQKTQLIVRSPKGVLYKLVGDTLQIGDYSNNVLIEIRDAKQAINALLRKQKEVESANPLC